MAAIVDSAAGLWWVVHRTEILPLRGAHFRAVGRGAGRVVAKEADDQEVCLLYEEAAELVEPESAVDAIRWRG